MKIEDLLRPRKHSKEAKPSFRNLSQENPFRKLSNQQDQLNSAISLRQTASNEALKILTSETPTTPKLYFKSVSQHLHQSPKQEPI